jgi:hemin uptake protein HemP
MTRNLKALGLALVAVFAFAAISASAASAETTETKIHGALTTTPNVTANIIGTEDGGNHRFEVGGGVGTVECEISEFHGHIAGKTTSPTFTPTYSICSMTLFGTKRPVTVTHNGCNYTLTAHHFTEGDTKGLGQLHLVCPEGKKIEIHVFNDGPPHANLRCTYTVEPQTINTGITFHNKDNAGPGGKDTVTIQSLNAPVLTKKSFGTVLQCGGSEFNSAYTGAVEAHATTAAGEPVDLEVATDT